MSKVMEDRRQVQELRLFGELLQLRMEVDRMLDTDPTSVPVEHERALNYTIVSHLRGLHRLGLGEEATGILSRWRGRHSSVYSKDGGVSPASRGEISELQGPENRVEKR